MKELKQILIQEQLSCIVKQNELIYKETKHGILPLLHFIEIHALEGSEIVDKVIGKAAAMLMVYGGIQQVHALILSEHALQIFQEHSIAVTYDKLVPYIINRAKDGMCPMEAAILHTQNIEEAYLLLRKKVSDMKKAGA